MGGLNVELIRELIIKEIKKDRAGKTLDLSH